MLCYSIISLHKIPKHAKVINILFGGRCITGGTMTKKHEKKLHRLQVNGTGVYKVLQRQGGQAKKALIKGALCLELAPRQYAPTQRRKRSERACQHSCIRRYLNSNGVRGLPGTMGKDPHSRRARA